MNSSDSGLLCQKLWFALCRIVSGLDALCRSYQCYLLCYCPSYKELIVYLRDVHALIFYDSHQYLYSIKQGYIIMSDFFIMLDHHTLLDVLVSNIVYVKSI